jgi:arylsulfatase A-like enzyme
LGKRELKAVYNAIGASSSLIIPIILFEIPNKLALSYFEPVFLAADVVGLLLMALVTVYLGPLLLSLAAARLPSFSIKSVKVAGYLSLVLVAVIFFSLTILPEITRPPYNPDAPNILVISIDTLRKDHLSYYGYDKVETPNIDGFLKSGTSFDNAYCSSPWTLPSLASFLTGYQPGVCGVDQFQRMPGGMTTLPEILHDNGYRTECYNTNFFVYPEYGFGRGFDVYMNADDIPYLLQFRGTRMYRVSSAFRASIKSKLGIYPTYPEFNRDKTNEALKRQGDRPFFIWCHFLDPHSTYAPPDEYIPDYPDHPAEEAIEFRNRSLSSDGWDYSENNKTPLLMLYDGETAYVDEQVGLIFDALEGSGHREDTVVVMFNDHGEEFWDHGRWGHGYCAYPEVADMVFAIYDPSIENQPATSEEYISHINIMPTLLEAVGIPVPRDIQGDSSYSIISDADYNGSDIPILTEYSINGEDEIKSIRFRGYSYSINIETGETELYYMVEDPGAFNDLSGTFPEIEDELSYYLDEFVRENEELRSTFDYGKGITLPKDRVDNLRALGYMGN